MSIKSTIKRSASSLMGKAGYEIRRVAPGSAQLWGGCRVLLKHVASPLILDVGANTGQTALELLNYFPNGNLICFEPDLATFDILQRNLAGRERASAFCIALGDIPGTALFHRHQAHQVNSLLPAAPGADAAPWKEMMVEQSTLTVPVETIDAWAPKNQHQRVHLLKTDCQGFDLHVLRGAEEMMMRGAVDIVVAEALFIPLYSGQAFFDNVLGWLRARGFDFMGLYEISRTPGGKVAWADALFVRGELLQQVLA